MTAPDAALADPRRTPLGEASHFRQPLRERFYWTGAGIACVLAALCPGLVVGAAFSGWVTSTAIASGYPSAEVAAAAFQTFLFGFAVISGLSLIIGLPLAVPAMWLLNRVGGLSVLSLSLAALAIAGGGCAAILVVMAYDASELSESSRLLPAIVWGSAACVLPSAGLAGLVAARTYHWLRRHRA